ncbi:hypothetical protein D3C75_967930 [compost metagenome]
MVQPGLQGAWDGEVVHRRSQHQYIGGQHFVGQFVGAGQRLQLVAVALLFGLHPATEQVGIQVRHRVDGQVAQGDLVARMGGLPLADEVTGQLPGDRTLLAGAAFDYEYTGHGLPPSANVVSRWR